MTRAGTSLLELLVALTIMGTTGLITVPLVVGTGRVASRTNGSLAAERTTASLAGLLRHDLRLATTDDILPTAPAMLWLGRPVGEGPVCATNSTSLLLRTSAWQGDRLPEAGRDRIQFLEPAPASSWREASLLSVAPGSCPDGQPALRMQVATDPGGSAHLRVLEEARVAAYAAGGASWLGLAGPGDPNQPFAGPVASGGLAFAIVGGALQAMVSPTGGQSTTLRFPVVAP